MAEITREEFMRRIGGAGAMPATAPAEPISVAPASQAALDEAQKKLDQGRLTAVSQPRQADIESITKLGARPGVPFDAESGIPFMQRIRNTFQPTEADEIKALEAAYGPGTVRKNAFGWLIVTKPGKDGRMTDTLVDPVGTDPGDLAVALSELPALVGGGLALKGAKAAPGIVNAAMNLLRVTGGALAGRAASDVATRGLESEAIQPTEIAARRGTEAALDVTTGAVMGVGAKALSQLISPFSNRGALQAAGLAARDRLGERTGVYLEMTPSEMSGSPFLVSAEAIEMNKPGASVAFDAVFKRKQQQIGEMQQIILGGAVPDEELAGQRAMQALGAATAPLERDVQRAAIATRQAASTELSAIGTPVDKTTVGTFHRQRAEAIRQTYRDERDRLYGIVQSDPRTQVKNISGDELADEADAVLARQVTVEEQVPGPVVGPTGQPVPVTTTRVVEEFSEPGVLPKLRALQRGRGQEFRLDELIRMRRSIDDDIARGEAIPGVQTREFNQLRESLTKRIQTGLRSIDPQLEKQWQTANDFVANNANRFQQAGVREFFREPEQPGFLDDTALIDRITGTGSKAQATYRNVREFFGATSPEMQQLHQAIRDDVYGLDRIEGFIDAKGFAQRLTKLAQDAPDVFNDAFGSNAASLRNSARALSAARGDTLPEEQLVAAVNSGNLSGRKLQEMLAAQNTKTQAYRNELVKAVSEGTLKPGDIKPTELVNRLVFTKDTQPADLQGLLAYIHDQPEVLEDLRRLTFQKALNQATVVHKRSGTKILSGDDLEDLLSDPTMAKRLNLALGHRTMQDLIDLKDVLKLGAPVATAAKTAGGMQAGSQVAGMVEQGALKYISRAVKNAVIAHIYTNPKAKALVTNTLLSRQSKADFVNALVVSAPFVNDLIDGLGEAGARRAAEEIHASLLQAGSENLPPTGDLGANPSREEFMRAIGAGVPAKQ